MTAKTARIARLLLLLSLGAVVAGCSFLANEFSVLDRAAPTPPATPPSATSPSH